ncbi:MAG: 4'-phosphopantetheinyl transferase family protein [Flavisolibacter sp.]
MPVFFQQDINAHTRLAIWEIREGESFFTPFVPLQATITHPHKRLQHLAGRYLLRFLYPDFPTALIRIADTRKPFLEDEAFHFSISHCGDYAAVIVSSQYRVGIDIEIPTEKVVRLMPKFLHLEEKMMINDPDEATLMQKATLAWSAKEAMFKWWGRGQVDFSEMLRLSGNIHAGEGQIDGRFIKEEKILGYPVHYRFFNNLVLAWVITESKTDLSTF